MRWRNCSPSQSLPESRRSPQLAQEDRNPSTNLPVSSVDDAQSGTPTSAGTRNRTNNERILHPLPVGAPHSPAAAPFARTDATSYSAMPVATAAFKDSTADEIGIETI